MFSSIVTAASMAAVLCLSASAAPIVTTFDTDGMIKVNGKRTLIIGSYSPGKSDKPFAELAGAGFNLVNTGSDKDKMDQALAAGLMTWAAVGTIDLKDKEASTQKLVAAVDAIKGHPALAFIESVDEPAWDWLKAEARVPWQAFAEAYPIIKKADPNHLLYLNHAPTNLVKTLKQYNAGTDIVACDIYPVNPGGIMSMFALFPDGLQGDFNNEHISQIGLYVDKMRQVTGPNRPLLMVLQAFAWEALTQEKGVVERREEKEVYPSYAQTRFMAYQSLIRGANGIIYFGSYTMPSPCQAWDDIKRVTREIADLSAPLAAPTSSKAVAVDYQEMGHSLDQGVQTLLKEVDGKAYLFTCNADKNFCKAVLSGFAAFKNCQVLGEKRSLPIEKDSITDTWKRFGVHVYELTK